jgi:chromosome segregation protein
MVRLEKLVVQGFKSFKRKSAIPFPFGFSVITGPNGSGKCVRGDTIVQLSDGSLMRIDELVNGKMEISDFEEIDDGFVIRGDSTQVVTMNESLKSEPRPVQSFIKRKSPEKLIRIKTRTGRELVSTEYHPLFLLDKNNVIAARADELSIGKRVAVPRKIPTGQKSGKFYGLLGMIKPEDGIYVPWRKEFSDALRSVKTKTWSELSGETGIPITAIKGLLDGQAINFSYLVKILRTAGFDSDKIMELIPEVKSKVKNKVYRMVWKNSPEFSRFLGYLLAEGRLTDSNQVWMTNGTMEIVQDYAELARQLFGVNPSINEYKHNCWDVIIYSHPLNHILSKFGMPFGGAGEKNISNLFLSNSSEDELLELVNGLYSGDGYVSKNSIELVTKSENLAASIQSILLRLGMISHSRKVIKVATNSGFSGRYVQITVYGSGNLPDGMHFTHPMKQERLMELRRYVKRNPNIDLVDANHLIKSTIKELGINVKKNRREFPSIDAYCYDQCTPSRTGLNHLIKNLFDNNPGCSQSLLALRTLSASDVLWDEIIEMEEMESDEEWVYDLSVKGNHNFVANGFFVHNSNIGDAISFVLGRTSSRSLRAKKTQDLIFHGSTAKQAAPEARVALYFDNSKKELPFEEKEVSVSRRINQKGISTYRINGRVVTRQQMVDVLAQIGIKPDGHNIIQQGDVNQIVEMDPVQRRGIIDNISGISEYNDKKDKALKELTKIEERVREAEILLNEKAQTMERIEKDREAALKYRELEGELEKIRSAVIWKDFSESEQGMADIEKSVLEKDAELQELEKSIKDYDEKISGEEQKLEQLTKDVLHAGDQIEVTKQITGLRGSMDRLRDRIDSNQREIDRIDEMMERLRGFDKRVNPAVKSVLELKMDGVHGTFGDLVTVPGQYKVAVEVAAGGHMQDIVVETTGVAVQCVKHLKENRIGRARFLPLDKINSRPKNELPTGALGWLSELVHHDPKYISVVDYVLSSTAAVNDIDKAKEIAKKNRVRMVTLDGDLVEASGAITGGFYKKGAQPDVDKYLKEKKKLDAEIEECESKLISMNKELEEMARKEQKFVTTEFERERLKADENLKRLREKRKESYEKRLILQQETGKLNIQKAKIEARMDNVKVQWEEKFKDGDDETPEELHDYVEKSVSGLEKMQRQVILDIQALGPVNMKALEDFDTLKHEFDEFREKVDKIVFEKSSIEETLNTIEEKRRETFTRTLDDISRHFREVYRELTDGEASLELENPEDIESGLMIRASPPGKKLLNIDSMSGGEKTLTAFTFLFAVQRHKPTPFYMLDEADATLDKTNTKRIADLIRKQSGLAQFVAISHNDAFVREADQVYGVTMEDGESKLMAIKLPHDGDEEPEESDGDEVHGNN